jgi:ferredoxin
MDVEIGVDRDRCIGSGQCVHVAPGAFEQDDDAKAYVAHPPGQIEEKLVHAVTACPVQAITLYLDAIAVGSDDLRDWAHGARRDDPVVSMLEQLGEDHEELRGVLTPTPPERAGHADEIRELTRAHLRREAQTYDALTALVDPRLVEAFAAEQRRINRVLDELSAQGADRPSRVETVTALTRALDAHMRLEENVLFPSALAALARR